MPHFLTCGDGSCALRPFAAGMAPVLTGVPGESPAFECISEHTSARSSHLASNTAELLLCRPGKGFNALSQI